MRKLGVYLGVVALSVSVFAGPAGAARDDDDRKHKDKDRTEQGRGRCEGEDAGACSDNSGGDCRDTDGGKCEDNDFSPSFDQSPVDLIVCLPMSTCEFHDGQQEQQPSDEPSPSQP